MVRARNFPGSGLGPSHDSRPVSRAALAQRSDVGEGRATCNERRPAYRQTESCRARLGPCCSRLCPERSRLCLRMLAASRQARLVWACLDSGPGGSAARFGPNPHPAAGPPYSSSPAFSHFTSLKRPQGQRFRMGREGTRRKGHRCAASRQGRLLLRQNPKLCEDVRRQEQEDRGDVVPMLRGLPQRRKGLERLGEPRRSTSPGLT